ncbi:MAG: lipoyl(octanoyl) transferase LipB [Sphingobacteriales bacterium]|nr:MAG: lipoyl(octanoyl) transferase LipB [Sphingobacteriales bacterium]
MSYQLMRKINFRELGIIEYGQAWDMQEAIMKKGLDAKAAWYALPAADRPASMGTENHLLLCSHPHVYTLGKSGHMENLLVNDSRLKELDIAFYRTNRGGDITYHGPGQIVGYPVLDLELFFTDLGRYMRSLEEVIIRTIAAWGIEAGRLEGSTGVWLNPEDPSRARKICAMGVRCSRWMTIHGFALNVNTDLKYFDYIVPCGISDKKVTSMEKELGYPLPEEEVRQRILEEFSLVFEAEIVQGAAAGA